MAKAASKRNTLYKTTYNSVTKFLIISMFINFVLAFLLIFQVYYPANRQYFATSVNSSRFELTSLDMPNQSDSAVRQWANQALISLYTFNFRNVEEVIAQSETFFTATGWSEFKKALDDANLIDEAIAKDLIVSAVVTKSPNILEKGEINGVYSWRVQMPLLITYQSASDTIVDNNMVTLLIVRKSTLKSPRGIGIAQLTMNASQVGVAQ